MKMKKFAVAAAIAMMGMSLMACGGKKTAESAAESKAEGAASVKTVSAGKLIMATNAEFPPYEYHEGNEIKGIDVEICRSVAEKLGLELQIEDVAFDAIIPEVASGKADLAAAGMTVTEDRKQNMDFSDTYATSIQLILVQENSSIAGKEDLTGKKIGVQLGTTAISSAPRTSERARLSATRRAWRLCRRSVRARCTRSSWTARPRRNL